ncbi:hypothetical protein DMN91_000753 [Ooceraea biroi]|uniref:Protein bric-a-brac n=1 Tax=Ooceraea biroi TaxID=2015173 RepID=A0A026W3V6_OOCBI|nr:protein jim lovell [Ooceraea biroi]EZA50737.1 Protein bric-a-brac [Ooceraea biroi]RLU26954.1 hypothetical protein DMN91_000753 [Ooceraea biroi]
MKEESMLSFKWQSFPTHLVFSLDTCYEKQQFVDLSLVCKDGTVLKCHKMVLANSSSFFRRLLVANDHPHPMIILHDVEADDLKTLVNFMYCGEIQIVQSEVRRLLKLAEVLQVAGLQHIPSSLLIGEDANSTAKEHYSDAAKKTTTTMSRVKMKDAKQNLSARSGSSGSGSEHEVGVTVQTRHESGKVAQVRVATHPPKTSTKVPADATRKKEEISINELCQRLETSNSGISIVDINDMPSTSRGLQNVSSTPQKRKESSDNVISWPRILSAISKDNPLPLKKLCIMDEVEITAGKPPAPVADSKRNEPLDRRKASKSSNDDHNMNMVFIKDEIDISSDVEEDVDMDPLEVDEIDNENADSSKMSTQQFYPHTLYHPVGKNARSHTEFPPRKGSNS